MIRTARPLLPVLLCAIALPLCAVFVRPWVELGIVDDWSYIRSAQLLAQTGHIVYNGYATAMLGWQLYLGALLIKVFGFSFSITRVGTLAIAVATAALMQRLFVRFGAMEWNAAAATLVFVLSPVFMAVSFSFMSDVYGIFVLIGCCYCCVRALQARTEAASAAWICAAALSDALGGTARQIAWLGVLVMVPCTLFLLRRNRTALRWGIPCTLAGIVSVELFLRWFNRQPYSIPESLRPPVVPGPLQFVAHVLPAFLKNSALEEFFLAMPLLLMFLPAMYRSRRGRALAAVSLVCCTLMGYELDRHHRLSSWTVPYAYNGLWIWGYQYFQSFLGKPPVLLMRPVRAVLTFLTFAGAISLLAAILSRRRATQDAGALPSSTTRSLSRRELLWVLLPCVCAWMALLVPRWIEFVATLDRYQLFPEFVLLVFALRLYQRRMQPRLAAAIWAAIAAMAVLNTAGLHDAFALFRAQQALLDRLTAAGVPRTALDGGGQYNGWSEITTSGHINDPRIVVPKNSYHPHPAVPPDDPCRTPYLEYGSPFHKRYVVSFDPSACGGPSDGGSETFHTWFAPHTRTLYAVKGPYYAEEYEQQP